MTGRRRARWARIAPRVALTLPAAARAQADPAREKRWADGITPSAPVGDPVYRAPPSDHRFLAVDTPSPKARAGAIVVHDIGVHPDWGSSTR